MILLFVYFISIALLLKLTVKLIGSLEILATSILLSLGSLGLVPFILREYLNVSYKNSFQLMLVVVIVLAIFFSIRNRDIYKRFHPLFSKQTYKGISLDKVILVLLLLVVCIRGLLLPVNGWDAYTLYDFRGVVYSEGVKQKDLYNVGQYDISSLYYFTYPPMTSSIHAVWYSNSSLSVMLVYALFFSSLATYLYLIFSGLKLRSSWLKWGLLFISVFNPLIFDQTSVAYTNLPALAFQFASIFYILKYTKSKSFLEIVLSAVFLAFSNWTRALEPIYLAIAPVAIFAIFSNWKIKIHKKIIYSVVYWLVATSTRVLWFNYLEAVVGTTEGFSAGLMTVIPKILDSLYLSNLLDVVFFIYTALSPMVLYFVMFVLSLLFYLWAKRRIATKVISILVVTLLTGIIMFLGTLYLSSLNEWWDLIPGSFLRSNIVLIPLMVVTAAFVLEKTLIHDKDGKS